MASGLMFSSLESRCEVKGNNQALLHHSVQNAAVLFGLPEEQIY